jgi:hypothetical protein
MFNSDDEIRQAQKNFNARLAGQRGKATARKAVKTKRNSKEKAKQQKKRRARRAGGDDDEDDESSDSAPDRADERAWLRKNELLVSDAEVSASDSDSDDDGKEEENPIDLILGKRTILIPTDPANPGKSNKQINRTEYLVKVCFTSPVCTARISRRYLSACSLLIPLTCHVAGRALVLFVSV